MKRAIDLILAGVGIVLLSPLLVLAAVLVRLDGPGPLFFRQTRLGLGGQPFSILKFRTMVTSGNKSGEPLLTVGGDARVTRFGRWLRRSKLDELPQLLNVLAGQMSLVGPRPEVPLFVEQWSEADRAQVLSVRPGVTDFASILFRDEEALLAAQPDPEGYYRRVLLPQKLRLCRFYVRRSKPCLDLWLIVHTVRAVLDDSTRLAPSRHRPRFRTAAATPKGRAGSS